MLTQKELTLWLRLTLTRGVGNDTARRLLAAFGLPEHIFNQTPARLREVVTSAQATFLQEIPKELDDLSKITWNWLCNNKDSKLSNGDKDNPQNNQQNNESDLRFERAILTLSDSRYPAHLLAIEDPPLMLYLTGQNLQAALDHSDPQYFAQKLLQGFAIVGTRHPTTQGFDHAQNFAHALSLRGFTVVSGLALGIDAAAHEGALKGFQEQLQQKQNQSNQQNNLKNDFENDLKDSFNSNDFQNASSWATIAVVGTGLDRVYPKQHRDLAHKIAQNGLLISEYPLGTPPLPNNFPKRNRLIAAFSQGTLVVEATPSSGSLVTARLTVEQGKDVFAIPGSVHNVQARGCHALIRQGAKLVETITDILEELQHLTDLKNRVNLDLSDLNQKAQAEQNMLFKQKRLQRQPFLKSKSLQSPEKHPHNQKTNETPSLWKSTLESETQSNLLNALGFDSMSFDALQAKTGLQTSALQAQLLELELCDQIARLPGGLFQRVFQA